MDAKNEIKPGDMVKWCYAENGKDFTFTATVLSAGNDSAIVCNVFQYNERKNNFFPIAKIGRGLKHSVRLSILLKVD